MPNPSVVRREKGLLRHTVHQLLMVDLIRYSVSLCRYLWLTRVGGRVRTLDARPAVAGRTVSHNLRGLRDLAVTGRCSSSGRCPSSSRSPRARTSSSWGPGPRERSSP